MSDFEIEHHTCLDCGKRQSVKVWKRLNVTLDPALRDMLFKSEINTFNCQECGMHGRVKSSLEYHDVARRFCVLYYPAEIIGNDDFLTSFTADGNVTAGEMASRGGNDNYLFRPHIVFDLGELVRYILFRERVYEIRKKR
jgi:hypothetical protein